MFVCLNCERIYRQKTIKNNLCKNNNCLCEVVEIDELFVPIVLELNKKGYATRFCCSGHLEKDLKNINSYIYFEDFAKLPNLPEGYKYDQDIYPDVDWSKWKVTNTIRRTFNSSNGINQLCKDIFENAISILIWAEKLDVLDC